MRTLREYRYRGLPDLRGERFRADAEAEAQTTPPDAVGRTARTAARRSPNSGPSGVHRSAEAPLPTLRQAGRDDERRGLRLRLLFRGLQVEVRQPADVAFPGLCPWIPRTLQGLRNGIRDHDSIDISESPMSQLQRGEYVTDRVAHRGLQADPPPGFVRRRSPSTATPRATRLRGPASPVRSRGRRPGPPDTRKERDAPSAWP